MKTNDIKTNCIISILALILSLIGFNEKVSAQSNNEVSFYLQGSFSKLKYEALGRDSGLENGFGIGGKYSYYINDSWSIGTGADIQYIEGSIFLPTVEGSYIIQDGEFEEFEFRYRATNFSENQEVYFLNIPVQVQYETSGTIRFYTTAGIKAGIVLSTKYQSSASSLETSGYYSQYDVELTSPEFAGFGEFRELGTSWSEPKLTTNFVAHMESGMKLMLENNNSLYMGFFLDYGLNKIQPDRTRAKLVNYNNRNPTDFTLGSILTASRDGNSSQFVNEVRTIAFGLKIRYGFQF